MDHHRPAVETPRVDLLAVSACLLAWAMAAVYLLLIRAQGNQPVAAVFVLLLVGGGLAAYGAWPRAAGRAPALVASAVVLALLGLLAILSIGPPILVAAGLALAAAVRQRRS